LVGIVISSGYKREDSEESSLYAVDSQDYYFLAAGLTAFFGAAALGVAFAF
jgi:hypothetical protein